MPVGVGQVLLSAFGVSAAAETALLAAEPEEDWFAAVAIEPATAASATPATRPAQSLRLPLNLRLGLFIRFLPRT
ncbi:hypothetical protein GCM10027456_30460 [Kineosporia babensis]